MPEAQGRAEREVPKGPEPRFPRVLAAEALFRGDREVWIEHEGTRYRLRLTRRNRLILQK